MATVMTSKGPPLPARGPPRRNNSADNPNPMKNVPLPPTPGQTVTSSSGQRIPSVSDRPLPPPPGQQSKHIKNIGRSASAVDYSNSGVSREKFAQIPAAIQNTSPRAPTHDIGRPVGSAIHHSHSAPDVPPSQHRSPPLEQGPPVPKRTASRHGNNSDQFTARKMVPDYTNKSPTQSVPSLPPSHPPSRIPPVSSSAHLPTSTTDRSPMPASSRPPPKPQRSTSFDHPEDNDIEIRFRFHGLSDFPEPEPFSNGKKTYPSRQRESITTDKNQSPHIQPYLGAL